MRNFFLAKPARPKAPVPKSVMVDGSGTDGAVGTMVVAVNVDGPEASVLKE